MLIQINNLRKTYGSREIPVNVLNDVSFSVDKGEFIALIGPSGCGKSTLLHIIGAMDSPDGGDICLEGNNLQKMKNRELTYLRLHKIGFIFQTFNLIPTLSALENVMLPMKLAGTGRKQARDKAALLLEKVDMKDRMGHIPSQLSGGQKQRVAIARALANDPAVILADEPTGNLDSSNGEIIMNLFQSLNSDGHTILMVTHNTELADRAGRVIAMKDGMCSDIYKLSANKYLVN